MESILIPDGRDDIIELPVFFDIKAFDDRFEDLPFLVVGDSNQGCWGDLRFQEIHGISQLSLESDCP